MCRLVAVWARRDRSATQELLLANNSLANQSRQDLTQQWSHADGWGIAVDRDSGFAVERGIQPAFDDPAYRAVAGRASGRRVVAHVRKASHGTVALENTHPFQHGCWLFAHNGTIAESLFSRLESETPEAWRRLRRGQTDSELIFLWLLARMHAFGLTPDRPASDLASLIACLGSGTRMLVDWSQQAAPDQRPGLNFLLTDGAHLAVTKWNRSLSLRDRAARGDDGDVTIASEPTEPGEWRDIDDGSIVAVGPDLIVQRHRFLTDAPAQRVG